MAINVSVQYNGGLLPDIVLLTQQCYYHWGTRFMPRRAFLSLQPMIPPKHFDIFLPVWEGLDAFSFFHQTPVEVGLYVALSFLRRVSLKTNTIKK